MNIKSLILGSAAALAVVTGATYASAVAAEPCQTFTNEFALGDAYIKVGSVDTITEVAITGLILGEKTASLPVVMDDKLAALPVDMDIKTIDIGPGGGGDKLALGTQELNKKPNLLAPDLATVDDTILIITASAIDIPLTKPDGDGFNLYPDGNGAKTAALLLGGLIGPQLEDPFETAALDPFPGGKYLVNWKPDLLIEEGGKV